MTLEEGKKAIEELKASGHDEEDILASMYIMFQNDEITLDELEALTHVMGYELTDEFKAMSPEDQKTKGYEENGEDESEEEKPTPAPEKEEEKPESTPTPAPKAEENSEDEKKKAMGYFGL